MFCDLSLGFEIVNWNIDLLSVFKNKLCRFAFTEMTK